MTESSKAFFNALKAAGVAVPPRCRAVKITAVISQPLVIEYECFAESPVAQAAGSAIREAGADACVIVTEVPRA